MTRQSLERYLYSRRNVAGMTLGLGGLALFFAGITTWPLWLPVVAGLYAIGVLVVPPQRGVDISLGPGEDASAIRRGLDALLRQVRGRVADDIYTKIVSIREGILATVSTDAAASGAERDLYLIRQTALDYLPGALNVYLALPRRYAERRPIVGGRTAHDVLLEQLQLMDEKMTEVADDIARHDTDRLLSHGRFLRDKFAGSSLDIGEGVAAAANDAAGEAAAPSSDPAGEAATTAVPDRVTQPTTAEQAAAEQAATEQAAAEQRERVH